jgi:hypothetical protein
MANKQYRQDGTYAQNVPIRLDEKVYEVLKRKADAEDMSPGIWLKREVLRMMKPYLQGTGQG